MDSLQSSQNDVLAEQDKVRKQLADLQKISALADTDIQRIETDIQYDRRPNMSFLRANSFELHSKRCLARIVSQIASEVEMECSGYEILGPDSGLARGYSVQFKGAGGIGERRCKKFMQVAKGSPPTYRENWLDAPDGRKIRAYVNFDKSKMQQRVENECKKFRNIIAERVTGKEVTCVRKD